MRVDGTQDLPTNHRHADGDNARQTNPVIDLIRNAMPTSSQRDDQHDDLPRIHTADPAI
jgi:hypothetical protein